MDFLKTLMLYMSLTFATSMQGAPVPEVTAVPAPTAVVETAAPQDEPLAAVTAQIATAAPSAEPTTPPEPTITPNKAYHNIKQGDRSNDVKKLQERLIELAYLPEDAADGAFGGQTRRAVQAFQAANGLTADGIAGESTQTHLYEDPDVKTNPNAPTPTPEMTSAPAPTAAPEATIPPAAETSAPAASNAPAATELPDERTWLWASRILFNDANTPLVCLRQEDGVTVTSNPRIYQLTDGRIQLSLTDLATALEDWALSQEGETISLKAAGYTLTVMPIDGVYTCLVDGQAIPLAADDVAVIDGEICVTADFLQKTLNAQTLWDTEESTLILRIQPKDQAQSSD